MGKGLGQRRRAGKKGAGFIAVVITVVLGMAAPALGALVLNLNLLVTPALNSLTPTNALGILDIPGGLAQTQTTLNQLLTGLNKGVSVAAPFVQAHATEATGTAITNLKTRLEATAAAALAADTSGAQSQVMGVVSDLQAQALGEVAGVLPLALTSGLQVVQDIVSPVCSLTAVPTSFIPGVGIDLSRLYKAAAPSIQQTDAGTDKLIQDTYKYVYDSTLASVNSIPNVGPIVGALLTLLKFNWKTSYTPPGTTTPIITETPAVIDVPTPLNVDGSTGLDLCATLTFALEGEGTSITGIKFTQTITKMPLAKPVLPVEVTGGLLNLLNLNMDSTESTAPIVYTSSATVDLAGLAVNIDNTYAVHRGTNLTIPPLVFEDLGTYTLPTIPPIFTPAPKPIITQKICIGECTALALKYRFENVPATTHVDVPILPLTGTKLNYSGASASDSFTYRLALGTTSFGTVVGGDIPAVPAVVSPPTPAVPAVVIPAPTSVNWCYDFTNNTCSNAPDAVKAGNKASLGFEASAPTRVQNFLATTAVDPTTCTSSSLYDSHVRGKSFHEGQTPASTTVGSGNYWVDTAGQPAEGCVGMLAAAALGAMPPSLNMPAGFSANQRNATYHTTELFGLILGVSPDAKSGSITCPTGTTASYTSISPIGQPDLQPVICSLPPTNTSLPVITGQALVDATLTASNGGWTPGSPNAPTFTKQWLKCNAAGAACAPITTGGTGDNYVLQYGSYPLEPTDFGHTFRVAVTAKNLDNPITGVTVTSAQTGVVALPPPPSVLTAPILGGNRQVGTAITATNGTYQNGATTFGYQWQRCDDLGTPASCNNIAGANASSYTIQTADKGQTVRIGVTGSNHGGTAPINYSVTAFIPPDPVNTAAPGIKNGPSNAVGAAVATGDNLSATVGTWNFTTSAFTYQWERCNPAGDPGSCLPIGGETGALYSVQHPIDTGKTLRVVVTGHGLNGDTPKPSGTTGMVLFNDLAAKPVTQIPDGTVNTTAAGAGTTTYVGGSFDTVGAPTGGSGLISDSGSGSTVNLASATAGAANGGVTATVPDGSGGYFLGGSFTQVKGVQCAGLAHLQSDGTVDANYCYAGLTGSVSALTRFGGTAVGTSKVLAVGGNFTLGGRSNLMFIDPANPGTPIFTTGGDPNGEVRTLATKADAANNVIYLGGKFSQAAGTQAALLASETLTWTSGQLSSVARNNWAAGVCIGTPGPGTSACVDPAASVNTVAWLTSGFVAVGGRFNSNFRVVNNATPTNQTGRNNALLVGDAGTGPTLLGWNPNIGGGNQTVNAIAVGPTSGISNIPVYIGGDFLTINGVAGTKNLGEFGSSVLGTSAGNGGNNNSGPMNTWLPNPNGPVTSLAWAGTNGAATLIVGGGFTTIDSRPNTATPFTTLVRHRLAKINIGGSTGSTLPVVDGTWDPNAGRTVRTVSRDTVNGTVTVGGDFVVLGGQTRNNLAEFDPNTGPTGWNPSANGEVKSLAFKSGGTGTVFAGGDFTSVGGTGRARLASIDGTSGGLNAWNPGADGSVNAIAVDGSTVYVGGSFANAGGQSRASLAAIDGGGNAIGWNPGTNGTVNALVVSGGNVYVGGAFANAGGSARNNAAAIDGSGNATGFDPNLNGAVNAIAINGAGVYLGGAFTQVGADGRAHVVLVNPTTGAVDVWNPGVDGNVNAVFLFGSNVFVGGSFANAGGAARSNLAALNAGSDAAFSFAPNPNGTVKALSRTSGGSIAVGGSFAIIAGQAAPALGFFGG